MAATGQVRIHPLGLGLDVDADGRAVRADGVADDGVWVVGGLRRGYIWETSSMREIRDQVAAVVAALVT